MCTALYSADYSCQSLVRGEKRRVGGCRKGGGELLEAQSREISIFTLIFTCSPVNEALKWHSQGNFYYKVNFD